ncbi:MAG: alpha/beta hydrolase [Deltaproteobacteria bacterium]|nr:alpha/beta hydrolase [Deltaproteobacteria bacterium]
MSYITNSEGKKVWYDVVGEGEPLVLIGGSSLVHRQWDFMIPILKKHFKCILYDQRGAGLSDRTPEGITVEQWADDITAILDEIGVSKTHVFGTSNGSFVVIRFAAKYPERTGAIVHYGMHKHQGQFKKMSHIGAQIVDQFGVGNGSLGAYLLVRLYGMPESHEQWETDRFEENVSPEAYKAMHDAFDADLSGDLPKIKAPQMILIGDTGSIGKESDYASSWKDVQKVCSNVEVSIVPGGEGTYCVVTHPEAVAEHLLRFLQEHRIEDL